MATFVQQVHNNSSASGTISVATAATGVGALLVVQAYYTGSTANATVTDDQGGTYTRVASALKATSADITGFYIRDQLTTSAAVHTVQMAPGTTSGGGLEVTEYSGFTRVGANAFRQAAKQENQAAATPAPVFGVAVLTTNPTVGIIFNAANPATMTNPTGWSEKRDTGYNNPTTGAEFVTRDSGFTGTTVTWGSASGSAFASLIVELDASVLVTGLSPTALTTATFAPTVTASDNQTVTPGVATLTATKFAPVLRDTTIVPVVALTLATFAPTVTVPANQLVTPSLATLTTTGYIPVLNLTVIPDRAGDPAGASLGITWFGLEPTVTVSDNQYIDVPNEYLALFHFAPPVVTVSDNQTAVPGVTSATLTAFAPSVALSDNQTATPGVAGVTLTTFAPTVTATDFKLVTPDPATLSTAAFAPTIAATAHQTAIPDPASLLLTGYSPTVPVGDAQIAQPGTASLTLTTFAPTVLAVEDTRVVPGVAVVNLTPRVPTVTATSLQVVVPGKRALHLSTFRPDVTTTGRQRARTRGIGAFIPEAIPANVMVRVPKRSLYLTPFPPEIVLDDRIPRQEELLVVLGIV